jgi:AbiV family abortive infection protein
MNSPKIAYMHTPLTPEIIAEGIERCIVTANDLYNSALILDGSQQKAVAHSLALHAYEEYGKIGWLFRAIIIPYSQSREMWKFFWTKYKDHRHKIKIGVTLRQRTTTGSLIPGIEIFFDSDNPIMPMHPIAFNEIRKLMLYLDYDKENNIFLGPRDRFGSKINNYSLIHEHLSILESYIAYNREKKVFHPAVLKLYNEIICTCSSHSEWNNYLRLFYHRIFKCKSGMSVEIDENTVVEELKKVSTERYERYSKKIADLSVLTTDNWTDPQKLNHPEC